MNDQISRQKLMEDITAGKYTTGNIFKDMELQQFIKDQPPADQCAFDFERVIETLNNRYDLAYELYKGTCSEYQAGRMEAYDTAVRMIEEYSNGEPADQWIPCSERPPKEPCIYTVEDCSPYTVNKHGEPQRRTIILKPFTWEPYHRVIAWKPINIEPYKGE